MDPRLHIYRNGEMPYWVFSVSPAVPGRPLELCNGTGPLDSVLSREGMAVEGVSPGPGSRGTADVLKSESLSGLEPVGTSRGMCAQSSG